MATFKNHTRPNGIKVVVNHDWISLNLGNNRRLTVSYGGVKASGMIPVEVFNAWDKASRLGTKGGTLGERVVAFADNMDAVWPEWNAGPDLSKLANGTKHMFKESKRKPVVEITVVAQPKRKGGLFLCQWPDGSKCKMPADMILDGGL